MEVGAEACPGFFSSGADSICYRFWRGGEGAKIFSSWAAQNIFCLLLKIVCPWGITDKSLGRVSYHKWRETSFGIYPSAPNENFFYQRQKHTISNFSNISKGGSYASLDLIHMPLIPHGWTRLWVSGFILYIKVALLNKHV